MTKSRGRAGNGSPEVRLAAARPLAARPERVAVAATAGMAPAPTASPAAPATVPARTARRVAPRRGSSGLGEEPAAISNLHWSDRPSFCRAVTSSRRARGVNPPRTLKMTSLDRFSVNALKGGREVRYTGLALGVSKYPANVGPPGAGGRSRCRPGGPGAGRAGPGAGRAGPGAGRAGPGAGRAGPGAGRADLVREVDVTTRPLEGARCHIDPSGNRGPRLR